MTGPVSLPLDEGSRNARPGSWLGAISANALRTGLPIGALTMLVFVSIGRGQDEGERQRALLLEQMQSLAAQTVVTFAESDREIEFGQTPVFRYADQPRNFVDATLWVWTSGGRPVAFQKVEAMDFGETQSPMWQFCFSSISEDLVSAGWPSGRPFRATEPGVAFQALNDAPAVAGGAGQRRRQARQLARGFSARIVTDPVNNTTQEMRLLSTALHEYDDPQTNQYLGAVYGLSTNGTNPDVLILLEVRQHGAQHAWHFAPARMTSGAVTLDYRDETVWQTKWLNAGEGPFPTWTYFVSPRTPPDDAGSDR
jgi:hypothetical protein